MTLSDSVLCLYLALSPLSPLTDRLQQSNSVCLTLIFHCNLEASPKFDSAQFITDQCKIMEELTGQLESLIERNKGFPKQLKQRLIQESTNVKNPFNFIRVLVHEGVLNDETNQQVRYYLLPSSS